MIREPKNIKTGKGFKIWFLKNLTVIKMVGTRPVITWEIYPKT